ncbi:MAG: hypothetical protein E4G98_02795 [Promethearchaeota archaeon]|nr:MAG: hypothetical protein E4G98_02795 [Candidatus Lokiarchaeota archaeon]
MGTINMERIYAGYMKYQVLIATTVSFVTALLFTLTPLWQLSLLAGAMGGFLVTKLKCGAFSAFLGTVLAWSVYVIIEVVSNQTQILFDNLGGLIAGTTGLGFWLILVVILVGGLLGMLGGIIGAGIRVLVNPFITMPLSKDELSSTT